MRDPQTGKRRRRVSVREPAEWIEIEGATPPIVSRDTFAGAQALLGDPRRRAIGKPSHTYRLRGRLRCRICGTPIVGQALQGGRYLYYRCRKSFSSEGPKCASRYVPVAIVEEAVRRLLADLLADPARVLAEARRLAESDKDTSKLEGLRRDLSTVEEQQRRLLRFHTASAMPEDVLNEESTRLARYRAALEGELRGLEAQAPVVDLEQLRATLPDALARIRERIEEASGDTFALLLAATQAQATASAEEVEVSGYIPTLSEGEQLYNGLVTTARTSA